MSKKPTSISDFGFFSEVKRAQITELLSKQVGLIVPGKNCFLLFLSSNSSIQISRSVSKNKNLFVLGLAGSIAEKRKFEAMFGSFESRFKVLFSQRDLNILVVHDFISELLKSFFFTRSSEEPMAVEFISAEVIKKGGSAVCSIGFDGKSKFWRIDDPIEIIGCADTGVRGNIILELKKRNTEELGIDTLKKQVEDVVKNNGFDNNTVSIEFSIE